MRRCADVFPAMPIYSYRCESCGHTLDVLRKISDPPLVVCPACGASAIRKQVTAAGFQLKGSGWYATDFRNPPAANADANEKSEKQTGVRDIAASDVKSSVNTDSSDTGRASTTSGESPPSAGDKSGAQPKSGAQQKSGAQPKNVAQSPKVGQPKDTAKPAPSNTSGSSSSPEST